jgi:GTP-binding protein
MFTVTIIGRPNVGKSSFFNRLAGRKLAIVHDLPGVTRDWREAETKLVDMQFRVIDTAGFEDGKEQILAQKISEKIDEAVSMADLLLLVIDGRAGVVKEDVEFASWVRKRHKSVILIINKAEGAVSQHVDMSQIYKLGFKEFCFVSSEHNEGMADLYGLLRPHYEEYSRNFEAVEKSEKEDLQIAIIGKPNVGKSTFINGLLGEDRLIASDVAGTTRDSITINWEFEGKKIKLIDTAGIRKKAQVKEDLEKITLDDSFRAVRFAQVVILLVDSTNAVLESQDITLANHVIKEGRGLIIALNKVDLLDKSQQKELLSEIKYQLGKTVSAAKNIFFIPMSALQKKSIFKTIKAAFEVYKMWNFRVTTAKLNQWLRDAVTEHSPPLYKGRRIKVKYITQAKTRPPTFYLFTSHLDALGDNYVKYLTNSLQEKFGLDKIAIRMHLRKSDNPYKKHK